MWYLVYIVPTILLFVFVRLYLHNKYPHKSIKGWTLNDLKDIDVADYKLIKAVVILILFFSAFVVVYLLLDSIAGMLV
jgi:quinol-cytochrome oxidoreductase complex cytochrome b subunit